jgi:plasmid stabilization system protein ParE
MMLLKWSSKALSDLGRLHAFLASANKPAAARVIQSLVAAPGRLRDHPDLGQRLSQFAPRNVRRLLVGSYEMQYEIRNEAIIILRIWHTREGR